MRVWPREEDCHTCFACNMQPRLQKFIMLLFLLLAPIIAIQVAETGTHPCRTLFVVIDFRCSYLNPYHLL